MSNYSVLDFGAVADGRRLDTEAVQKAVDACAAAGGTVWFPKGTYVLSTVFLKSGVHIRFEDGTVVLGSLNFYDYAPQEAVDYPLYQDASHSYFHLAMFVGIDCDNISFGGRALVDMRSVWDEDGVRGAAIVHRGPKCISLKNCTCVEIADLELKNVTDLAVYFAGCRDVEIHHLRMQVYIDGISPDNCERVRIHDCDVESGDDGIVFKSSYTLNRLGVCRDIRVWNCRVKSRCSAIKFGTETNGGFEDITVEDIDVFDTRITAIAIESVDGAVLDGVTLRNIRIRNAGGILYICLGDRMRGPSGRPIGAIRNLLLENITADGPYEAYDVMPWNYFSFKAGDTRQEPWSFRPLPEGQSPWKESDPWQQTSNVCGLPGHPLENVTLRNVHLTVSGGVSAYETEVAEPTTPYPEIYNLGWILPAKGIFFRHINGLTLENVTVRSIHADTRPDFVFEDVCDCKTE